MFYLPVKRTWPLLLPGAERPRGEPPGLGCRGEAGRGGGPAGLAEAFRPYGGPTSRRAWLGFPAFGAERPHKDGIHAEALDSLRNEAGFK